VDFELKHTNIKAELKESRTNLTHHDRVGDIKISIKAVIKPNNKQFKDLCMKMDDLKTNMKDGETIEGIADKATLRIRIEDSIKKIETEMNTILETIEEITTKMNDYDDSDISELKGFTKQNFNTHISDLKLLLTTLDMNETGSDKIPELSKNINNIGIRLHKKTDIGELIQLDTEIVTIKESKGFQLNSYKFTKTGGGSLLDDIQRKNNTQIVKLVGNQFKKSVQEPPTSKKMIDKQKKELTKLSKNIAQQLEKLKPIIKDTSLTNDSKKATKESERLKTISALIGKRLATLETGLAVLSGTPKKNVIEAVMKALVDLEKIGFENDKPNTMSSDSDDLGILHPKQDEVTHRLYTLNHGIEILMSIRNSDIDTELSSIDLDQKGTDDQSKVVKDLQYTKSKIPGFNLEKRTYTGDTGKKRELIHDLIENMGKNMSKEFARIDGHKEDAHRFQTPVNDDFAANSIWNPKNLLFK
jgi:hypothetical protein